MTRFLVSMPDSFIEQLDEQAELESRSRSDIIRELVSDHFAKQRDQKEKARKRATAVREMDKLRRDTHDSEFDSTEYIKNWRNRGT